jgi:hypothetical protein
MNPFLFPIEKPRGLMMKLAYYFTRKQFGKVLTPVKVHAARLPTAFGLFYAKVGRLDKKLTLPSETVLLIRQQVARLNLPVLYRYRSCRRNQSDDEGSEIRRARPIPHQHSF